MSNLEKILVLAAEQDVYLCRGDMEKADAVQDEQVKLLREAVGLDTES